MTVTYAGLTDVSPVPASKPKRDVGRAMLLGAKGLCPNCGQGRLFGKYLKVEPGCKSCGEELHHHRADDAPPYFTIFIVGHVILPIALAVEVAFVPSMWVHFALWLPLIVISSLVALPPIKGALIGLQWANYMHGFDPNAIGDDQPMYDFGGGQEAR
ncbi:DUF983 domain-containing protein [Stappia sp. ES.058]|uniref:DUF983 domain-containing protein n=1 Tax=Stappia sp. ES.058 TaxID=1881061 RepID=UPI00087C8F87|nr:DUF983 domain-containing protein [Stappia sp. ES.058]SDU19625.1 Uncharacterized conserved protein, DUF983 family [Stappia sp. ES.058]